MPIFVKDYSWEETDSSLWIHIPLKGVHARNVDIFTSDEYIKVNYPPYFFECLLAASVDDSRGTVQIGNGVVKLKLVKQINGLWNKLHSSESDNKEIMKKKREEALLKYQKKIENDAIVKSNIKRENGKIAINEMMKIEQSDLDRISTIKNLEKQKANAALEKWKEEQRSLAEKEKERLAAENRVKKKGQKEKSANIFGIDSKDKLRVTREAGSITVKHTPRVFPTPTRESQALQEEEWLKKQADARKSINMTLDKDLSEKEKDPHWLLERGKSCYASGDYHSAINAFTYAIYLAPKLSILYSNRAACHLKLKNLFKCIEDCSKALDLLFPPVQQNAASRARALIRRGTAFCMLEMYIEGLRDYEAALTIEPQNEAIQADIEKIRNVIQSSTTD